MYIQKTKTFIEPSQITFNDPMIDCADSFYLYWKVIVDEDGKRIEVDPVSWIEIEAPKEVLEDLAMYHGDKQLDLENYSFEVEDSEINYEENFTVSKIVIDTAFRKVIIEMRNK